MQVWVPASSCLSIKTHTFTPKFSVELKKEIISKIGTNKDFVYKLYSHIVQKDIKMLFYHLLSQFMLFGPILGHKK